MRQDNTTKIDELMEEIISTGAENMGAVFGELFNIAMRIERERFLEAEPYARSDTRRGYANGFKPKRLDTQVGTITVNVPKTRDHDEPFYPQALERGQRSSRAILLAIAEMYIQGVSTRDVERVMSQFGIANVSSTQVSRACQMLDQELEAWRTRPLGLFKYLILDARYEKVRRDGVVQDVAVLSAIGIDAQGRRHLLGVSIAISEAEIHWRTFLESLIKRGLYGVAFVVSDDHSGLKAARRAVLGGALWQRCQYHLAANAIQNAPNLAIRKRIGDELRSVWNAPTMQKAQQCLKDIVLEYADAHPKFSQWLENNVPEGLTVFALPAAHHKRMRTSNVIERCIQQEIKRRTRKIRIFPNEASLERLVTAILVEIDEAWSGKMTPYLSMEIQENDGPSKEIYRRDVA